MIASARPGFFARLRRRLTIVHPLRPIEVPVLTEVKRLLARGEYDQAVLFAYPTVLRDVERAYGVQFSPAWTHEEILVHGMHPEMERLPEFLLTLYRVYEPVRYGHPEVPQADRLSATVQSIYTHRPMWELYKEHFLSGDTPEPETAGTNPARPAS